MITTARRILLNFSYTTFFDFWFSSKRCLHPTFDFGKEQKELQCKEVEGSRGVAGPNFDGLLWPELRRGLRPQISTAALPSSQLLSEFEGILRIFLPFIGRAQSSGKSKLKMSCRHWRFHGAIFVFMCITLGAVSFSHDPTKL